MCDGAEVRSRCPHVAGARAGLVAVDDKTIAYVKGRPFAPAGIEWEQAVKHWRTLHSDPGAHFDRCYRPEEEAR